MQSTRDRLGPAAGQQMCHPRCEDLPHFLLWPTEFLLPGLQCVAASWPRLRQRGERGEGRGRPGLHPWARPAERLGPPPRTGVPAQEEGGHIGGGVDTGGSFLPQFPRDSGTTERERRRSLGGGWHWQRPARFVSATSRSRTCARSAAPSRAWRMRTRQWLGTSPPLLKTATQQVTPTCRNELLHRQSRPPRLGLIRGAACFHRRSRAANREK